MDCVEVGVRLSGVIPANVLSFRGDLSIDVPSYRRHVDHLAGTLGVSGVVCNGHAAEVTRLSRKERRLAVAVAAETVASRVPVIAGLQAPLLCQLRNNNLAAAQALYGRIQLLTRVIYRAPMVNMYARMKEHLIMLGHDISPAVRRPLESVTGDERTELRQALVDAGLLHGER
jgi:dihydrodipicolinate synthase/N-acetylneuraminate lyase